MARKTYRSDDWVWIAEQTATVWDFLLSKEISQNMVEELAKEKLILVNGHKCTTRQELEIGQEIRLQIPKEKIDYEPIPMELNVVYEDEDILVLNKPVGVTVNSKGHTSVANGVAAYFMDNKIKRKIRFLNRLDRDTSGCLVIAKSAVAQSLYQQQMETHIFRKWYIAQVDGVLDGEGVIEVSMKKDPHTFGYRVDAAGKETVTKYKALEIVPVNVGAHMEQTTTVEIELRTGKTHQIRVAMAHIGHPLTGDTLYGGQALENKETFSLHAKRIEFIHIRTGEKVICEC